MNNRDFKEVYDYIGNDKIVYIITTGISHDPMSESRIMLISAIRSLPESLYMRLNCNVTRHGIVQFQSNQKGKKFNSYVVRHSVLFRLLSICGISLDDAIQRNIVRVKGIDDIKNQQRRKFGKKVDKEKPNKKEWICETKQELTRKSTKYERAVLKKLSSALGNRIKVQHPFVIKGKIYFADMCIKSKKLIIEVDGGYHNSEEQKEKDSIRDKEFESIGYRTLRITNEQTMNKKFMQNLIQEIKDMKINRVTNN